MIACGVYHNNLKYVIKEDPVPAGYFGRPSEDEYNLPASLLWQKGHVSGDL